MFVRILLIFAGIHLGQAQLAHFFGPPAVGFGVGLVSVHRNFPVATSIVSRRSSRSYSQQSFVQSTPFGTSSKFCSHLSGGGVGFNQFFIYWKFLNRSKDSQINSLSN